MQDSQSDFFRDVHEVARLIPRGRVTSYGAIARYLGIKRSARMVGWAMNQAHGDQSVPAHRVVNRAGVLTGKHFFEGGEHMMQQLLEAEGVTVQNDQVVDFEKFFWDPVKELSL